MNKLNEVKFIRKAQLAILYHRAAAMAFKFRLTGPGCCGQSKPKLTVVTVMGSIWLLVLL